ncbi:hypothetical protein, partial [Xanthomonas perforans]|uniref:hypothetical protein n=1 Tax=Xanthomonas perforans TaxID=442694 RepID=UPI001F189FFE
EWGIGWWLRGGRPSLLPCDLLGDRYQQATSQPLASDLLRKTASLAFTIPHSRLSIPDSAPDQP